MDITIDEPVYLYINQLKIRYKLTQAGVNIQVEREELSVADIYESVGGKMYFENFVAAVKAIAK